MNKKTQSKPIAKLANVARERKIVQICADDKIKTIINTNTCGRKKREQQQVRKDSNASTGNDKPQMTEETAIDTGTLGARESKAKA
jgi:hypothetical protein